MKKSDLLLAQKNLLANERKLESKIIKTLITDRSTNKLSQSASGSLNYQSSFPDILASINKNPSQSTFFDTNLNKYNSHNASTTGTGNFPSMDNTSFSKEMNQSRNHQEKVHALSEANTNLVKELATRAVTATTSKRKVQNQVARDVMQITAKMSNSRLHTAPNSSSRPTQLTSSASSSSLASTTILEDLPEIDLDRDNIFMPKKTILRPDGASLFDIYKSKKEDSWGKIIRAQYKEELMENKIKKQQKDESDRLYGRLIKKQLHDEHMAAEALKKSNNDFGVLEDLTAKKTEDLQKFRMEDAVRRHKQFIANAVSDMAIKSKRLERDMKEDLLASAIMIKKDNDALVAQGQKKEEDKKSAQEFQEIVFQDNLVSLERKRIQRLNNFAEDKRIINEYEKQRLAEIERRKKENDLRLSRSTEGPAHHVVHHLVEEKSKYDKQFYDHLYTTENMLNKQLKASDDAAKARVRANGLTLEVENQKFNEHKMKTKKELEDHNNKILATMREMLITQEKEDIAKRQAKVEAGMRYQRELDEQLRQLRLRSFNALAKTMSDQEQLYNSDLLKKTAIHL